MVHINAQAAAQSGEVRRASEIAAALKANPTFKRACSVMSSDGGLRDFIDAKLGKKWKLTDYPLTNHELDDGYEIGISRDDLYDFGIEYGVKRLAEIFAAAER